MKKIFIIMGFLLATVSALILPRGFGASARGALVQQSVVIDFENLPPGSLTNQFAHLGVIFNQPTVLNYQQMPGFAHSGVKGIEQCYSEEFCSAPVEMSFTTGQRRVKVWVGYSDSSTTSQTVMLRALDAAGAEIGRATTVLNPSSGPRPINTPLEVSLPAANIRRALLSFSPANLETNRLAVDDIEFSTAGMPPPCASTQNPTMNLIQPGNNQTVQFNAFTLEARVTSQDPFATYMTMTVSGPGGATRSEQLNLSNGRYGPTSLNRYLFPGRNTIDLTFRDCRGMVQRTFSITYTPIPDGTSFELLGIEVTQATQGAGNSVPLVANKAAVARVFLRIQSPLGQTATIRDVFGRLTARRRNGAGVGEPLPDETLRVLNTSTVDTSTNLAAKRVRFDGTINFVLPAQWLTVGELHLSFRPEIVGSPSSPSTLPCTNCDNLDPASSRPRFVQFRPTRPLNLILAPYIYQPPNAQPRTADFLTVAGILQWVNNVFPLAGNFPQDRTGINLLPFLPMARTARDLSAPSGQRAFLNDVRDVFNNLRGQGGLPRDVRLLAMVPCNCGGRAYLNGRVGFAQTWALEDGLFPNTNYEVYGSIWAHELGHNFGREHAGNAHGEDVDGSGIDTNFPYNHGGIGLAGMAIITELWRRTPFFIPPGNPSPTTRHAHDFMSYGINDLMNTNIWVSDYTYRKLFDVFAARQAANISLPVESTGPVEKLVATGDISADGSVELQPFYRTVTGFSSGSGAQGEFSLQLLDAQGRMLVEHRFDSEEVSDDKAGTISFSEFVPWQPATRRIVLKRKEKVLAERTVSPHAPKVRVLSPNGGELLGTETAIHWEASDSDGDPLTYTVLYNNGKDTTWWPAATGVTTTSISVDTSLWPGSSQGRVMVRVTDGVNAAEDISDRIFTVPQKKPLVGILRADAKGQLMGFAYDPEDGLLPPASLVWTSDRDGLIEPGPQMNLKSLSAGTHTITLTVTDSQGQTATAQVSNLVRQPSAK